MRLPAGRARNRDWFRVVQKIFLFPRAFRMVLGSTQSPVQSVPEVRASEMRSGVKLVTHFQLIPKLRKRGAMSPIPHFFCGLVFYQLYIWFSCISSMFEFYFPGLFSWLIDWANDTASSGGYTKHKIRRNGDVIYVSLIMNTQGVLVMHKGSRMQMENNTAKNWCK